MNASDRVISLLLLLEDIMAEEEALREFLFILIFVTKHKLQHKRKWMTKVKAHHAQPLIIGKSTQRKHCRP
jgi:hypothetical protein